MWPKCMQDAGCSAQHRSGLRVRRGRAACGRNAVDRGTEVSVNVAVVGLEEAETEAM